MDEADSDEGLSYYPTLVIANTERPFANVDYHVTQ
jgi:hypothetical protein